MQNSEPYSINGGASMSTVAHFETDNLFLAAFLHAKGQSIAGTKPSGNKVAIVFDGTDARELHLKYINGDVVEATRFVESYVTLKKMVKNESKR